MTPGTLNDEPSLTNGAMAEQGVYPGTVYARGEQISAEALRQLSRESFLSADRNQWFLVTLVLCGALAFVLYQYILLTQTSATHREVIWVKMYDNGTWDIEPHDNHASIDILEATVNSVLKQWVTRRFSQVPTTVLADYTYANYFLSPALTRDFTGAKGFHAAQTAAEVQACLECPVLTYAVRTLDHYDQEVGTFASGDGTFYRTHLFVTATRTAADGQVMKEEARIIRVQWRLMTPVEIHAVVSGKNGQAWLDQNPIGLEITAYHDLDDPSATD